jgi:hypothetical protein
VRIIWACTMPQVGTLSIWTPAKLLATHVNVGL